MIKKLLVPNRGEIAVRIARACREMGIASALAFSESDDVTFPRRFFDDAVSLGSGDARSTYLDVNKVIDAARACGADALHPGYGFLSERAELAAACADAGIVFVGPTADSIAAMGSKAHSRHLMSKLGVPVVPGYDGDDQDPATLAREAARIGFPLLVKASAGGGGKGMKVVTAAAELAGAIESAQRESLKAFGDDRLLLERYIEQPRHIEFQIFGDGNGNVVHLFERDCSLQRRHQKVVEESPAPRYPEELRQRMDTRLQVEHPVTEQVVGVDLVRAQLELASGSPLPWRQEDLRQRGHAIEVRVYAEDPDDRFLPQSGTIGVYREPSGPGVRVDAGVTGGSTIGVLFDPMLAKLIAFAESRETAIDRLVSAIGDYAILGTKTNLSWLRRALAHPAFRSGLISTRFLADHEEELRATVPEVVPLIAAMLASEGRSVDRPSSGGGAASIPTVWDSLGGWGRG